MLQCFSWEQNVSRTSRKRKGISARLAVLNKCSCVCLPAEKQRWNLELREPQRATQLMYSVFICIWMSAWHHMVSDPGERCLASTLWVSVCGRDSRNKSETDRLIWRDLACEGWSHTNSPPLNVYCLGSGDKQPLCKLGFPSTKAGQHLLTPILQVFSMTSVVVIINIRKHPSIFLPISYWLLHLCHTWRQAYLFLSTKPELDTFWH